MGLNMSKGPSSFRVTDANRLTQALTGAGKNIVRVELERGKVVFYTDNGGKAAEPNEWAIDDKGAA
jgi:hypothetical protein